MMTPVFAGFRSAVKKYYPARSLCCLFTPPVNRRFGPFFVSPAFDGETIAVVAPVDCQLEHRCRLRAFLRMARRYVPVKHKDTGKYELVLISELEEMKRNGLIVSERRGDVFVDPK